MTLQKRKTAEWFLKIFSVLVLAVSLFYMVGAIDDGSVYHDVLRLHVIANSDDREDQELKLEVRDRILETYGEKLSGFSCKEAAETAARELLPDIAATVTDFLRGRAPYTATVTVAEEYFPTKTYGAYSLPRGVYTALCIRLGKAAGENFFCVLYPPLCLGAATADADADGDFSDIFLSSGLTAAEYELMRGEKPVYRVRFKLLEWLHGADKPEPEEE